jgi:hypothetical protein
MILRGHAENRTPTEGLYRPEEAQLRTRVLSTLGHDSVSVKILKVGFCIVVVRQLGQVIERRMTCNDRHGLSGTQDTVSRYTGLAELL